MIRVAAFDLDGTLLRSDATVSPRTIEALAATHRCGVRCVAVTARPPRFVRWLATETNLRELAICANGAILDDPLTGRSEVLAALPIGEALTATEVLREHLPAVGFAVETGEFAVAGPGYGHRGTLREALHRVDSDEAMFALAETCVKLLAWSPAQVTDQALAACRSLLPRFAVTHSGGTGMFEIQARGVSKAATLARLCATWGVPSHEVLAFGDMPNDLPMLRWAGHPVAVANAHPRVLDCVETVAPSNDDDGVATVLEHLFYRLNMGPELPKHAHRGSVAASATANSVVPDA